jgi:hypothetical protein
MAGLPSTAEVYGGDAGEMAYFIHLCTVNMTKVASQSHRPSNRLSGTGKRHSKGGGAPREAHLVSALALEALESLLRLSAASELSPPSEFRPSVVPDSRYLWCCAVNSFAVWIMMSHLSTHGLHVSRLEILNVQNWNIVVFFFHSI